MSGSQKLFDGDEDFLEEAAAAELDQAADEGEYEEIRSDEVDRVVQSLEELMSSVESENIRAYLEEAADNIFSLVYEAEEFETVEDIAAGDEADLADDMAA